MRFASLQGSNTGDYAAAGKSAADSAVQMFAAQKKSAPDYGKLSQIAMVTNTQEKIASMQASAKVTNAGVSSFSKVTQIANNEKAKKEIRGIAQKGRKAGVIAGLGKMAAAGFLAASDNTKGREYPKGDARGVWEKWLEGHKGIKDRQANESAAIGEYTPEPVNFSSTGTPGGDAGKITGGSDSSPSQGASGVTPAGTGMAYMKDLTAQGFTPTQAAAIAGHMDVESDGFRAFEEYAPNRHGTRGIGHMQWTDPTPGKGRRTSFLSHAQSQGLDPKSYEANRSYLIAEMAGNYGNHWTNGGSLEGFKQIKDFNQASAYLQNKYIRPGIPHTDRRIAAGQRYLQQYNQSLTN